MNQLCIQNNNTELCDDFIHDYIKIYPLLNDYLQLDKYKYLRSKMIFQYSSDFISQEFQLYKKYNERLKTKKILSFYDTILNHDIQSYLLKSKFNDKYIPLTSIDNFYSEFMIQIQGIHLYQFTDIDSYQDFMKRIKKIPSITQEIIKNMKQGINYKTTIPRRIIQEIIDGLEDIMSKNTPENRFNHSHKIPIKIKSQFIHCISKYFITSVTTIHQFLQTDYIHKCRTTIGLSSIPYGEQYYKQIIERDILPNTTPSMLMSFGHSEMKRINKEIKNIQQKLKFEGSLQSFKLHMINSNTYHNQQDIMKDLHRIQKKIKKKLFPKYFYDTCESYKIKAVPKELSNNFAYYIGPDKQQTRKGVFYINTKHPELIHKDELAVLSIHEGNPGHHYQVNYHMKHKNIPLYIQSQIYDIYSEGWALYTESFTDIYSIRELYWKYIYELQRSLRLVLDTGIHYYKWSYEKCFDLMKTQLCMKSNDIKDELYRYICLPGQALTYKCGESIFMIMRDKYLQTHKNCKDFHKHILSIGPCPIQILMNTI